MKILDAFSIHRSCKYIRAFSEIHLVSTYVGTLLGICNVRSLLLGELDDVMRDKCKRYTDICMYMQ